MSDRPSFEIAGIEESRSRIRQLVSEVAGLSRKQLAPDDYFDELLARVIEALAAVGGAVWWLRGPNELVLGSHLNLQASSVNAEGEHQQRHARLLRQVAQRGEPASIPPHTGLRDESGGANPTELLLVIVPVKVSEDVEALVEIFHRPTSDARVGRGYVAFLSKMADLASQWLTACRLKELKSRQSAWQQGELFARSVHESLELKPAAFALANESRAYIGCDRVSIAVRRGRQQKIEAISGQDTLNPRANIVQCLRRLAQSVADMGEPLWYSGKPLDLPPEVESVLDAYLDESHTKTIAVVPLRRPEPPESAEEGEAQASENRGDVIGALIVEQMEDLRPQAELAPLVEVVSAHAERALANSLEYNDLVLLPVWRKLRDARKLFSASVLPKTLLATGIVTAIVVTLAFFPARFDLAGKGTLEPVAQRDIFADTDGIVSEVLVEHGTIVQQGQPLVRLTNTDLEVRLADLVGQKQSTQERIAMLDRSRHETSLSLADRNRVGGEIVQLEQHLAGLVQQYDLTQQKLDRLTLVSPIAGQVITWNLEQKLLHRPVSSGQLLLTVADSDGPWELEIFMPEHRMAHVMAARREAPSGQAVEYILATDPAQRLQGTVREIHAAADLHEEYGNCVRVFVDVDRNDLKDPRPGAAATARIACGTRSLGYVWFHDVYEFLQSRVFFYWL